MPGYAAQRFFFHASGYLSGPALGAAIVFLFEGDFRDAGISAGVFAVMGIYWLAFYEKRDLTAPRKSRPGSS